MNTLVPTLLKRGVLYSLILLVVLLSKAAYAQQYNCKGLTLIKIEAPDESMVKDICTASGKALFFLDQYNLLPKRAIKVQLVESAINSHGYIAYGSYDRQNDLIRLMSMPSILATTPPPQMYDQPFDREHYHGAIAHEITHAVFHHNTGTNKEQLTNVSQEYLAHSTQLTILSPERRSKIIQENDVGPWESGDSISVTYMGLNPTGFAVKSYLHFSEMVDPQPFIKILLNNNWFFVSVP